MLLQGRADLEPVGGNSSVMTGFREGVGGFACYELTPLTGNLSVDRGDPSEAPCATTSSMSLDASHIRVVVVIIMYV